MIDLLLFGVFPYVAIVLAIVGTIWRFRSNQFTFSTLSSQFLEGRQLFWGSVPWHFGILAVLIGHFIGIVFPASVKAFNGVPIRLYILEATALAFGLMALTGLILLIVRRGVNLRIRRVTSVMDIVLLALLLAQVIAGVGTALFYSSGSFWFLENAVPYLWSLVTFSPNWSYVAPLPFLVKLHAVNAFVLVAIFPFTKLVHIISLPLSYLWRPYQVVRWHRRWIQQ